jgi:hypothetical protein
MEQMIVQIETEGQLQPATIEVADRSLDGLLNAIRSHARLGGAVHIFEHEKDDELAANILARNAISVTVSRCKRIVVGVRFEHKTLSEKFAPSATIFRVLRWAIGKKGFNLDDTAQAKANLILPGSESPLPRDATIGRYVDGTTCSLTLDLILRDFTNG